MDGWASELVWTQRLEEKSFASAGDRTNTKHISWRRLPPNEDFATLQQRRHHILFCTSCWQTIPCTVFQDSVTIRSFTIYNIHQILRWSKERRLNERDTKYAREIWKNLHKSLVAGPEGKRSQGGHDTYAISRATSALLPYFSHSCLTMCPTVCNQPD
jgi:hypothetical protein